MMLSKKILSLFSLILLISLMCVIVFSWIVSSINPSLPIRSMISEEGVRQFIDGFTSCLSTPLLVWLLVCSIAWGVFIYSGFYDVALCVCKRKSITYRQKHALVIAGIFFVLYCIIITLLTFVPHATLLGVTGELYPSAFMSGLVPLLAFVFVTISLAYGISCGKFCNLEQVYKSFYVGIKMSAPLWPIYIFVMQLYFAIMFVFE